MITASLSVECDETHCHRSLSVVRTDGTAMSLKTFLDQVKSQHGWALPTSNSAFCFEHRRRPIRFHPLAPMSLTGFYSTVCDTCNKGNDHINHHPERVGAQFERAS